MAMASWDMVPQCTRCRPFFCVALDVYRMMLPGRAPAGGEGNICTICVAGCLLVVPHVLRSPAVGATFLLLLGATGSSRPRHAQSFPTDDEDLRNVGSQTVPSPRRGWTEEKVRGMPRRSQPLSPLGHQPQTWSFEMRVKCVLSRRTKTAKNLRGADPRNGGRRPQNRTGYNRGRAPRAVGGRRRTCWSSPTSCWRSLLGCIF